MASVAYPSVRAVPPERLWSLLWAVFFLLLLNIGIALLFRDNEPFVRFRYHTSYQDVRSVLETIAQDPRRKVVFLGGSVMWGSSTEDPSRTIPAAFRRHLPPDTAVYNLGMIGGRPLDSFLLAFLLQGKVDLFVLDYNYQFGAPVARERLLREPSTYVRLQELYHAHAPPLFGAIPGLHTCMEQFDLPLPAAPSIGEPTLRRWMERVLPVLRYKDRINDALFGQHPLLFIEQAGLHAGDLAAGTLRLRDLFSVPEEQIDPTPWQPKGTADEAAYRETVEAEVFSGTELLDCQSRAFAQYASKQQLPVVTYILPNNPAMFPGFKASPIHARNIDRLLTLFHGTSVHNLDTQTLPGSLFTDSTHLTPEGNERFARDLFETIRRDPAVRPLLAN